jgi:serine/threonine protein kinase
MPSPAADDTGAGHPALAASIPLLNDFRFTHEPIPADGESRFVGRETELQRLAERILFSDGGSFLIAGYRGVGKTSFVNRVIRRVRDLASLALHGTAAMDVIDIHLTLARPLEAVELMHHIVRRLRERLIETGIFRRLPATLRREIDLAWQRTSMSVTLNRATKSVDPGISEIGVSVLGTGLKMRGPGGGETTSGHQWAYLAYDDRAAESDLMRISARLASGYDAEGSWLRRMFRVLEREPAPKTALKIVFVFDELDKIDEEVTTRSGEAPFLDRLLGHLKNLFTTSHISFVFVAGKDLYDRWLLDVGRGDSVYESVFCYDRYIPCMWTSVEEVCRSVIPVESLAAEQRTTCDEFITFLNYKGRGIPRKLLREFHYYVGLDGDRLQLTFNRDDRRRFRFYGELQKAIDEAAVEMFGANAADASAIEYDRKRLAAYYLIDWVLEHGATEFAEEQAVAHSRALSAKIAPAEDLAAAAVSSIVRMLVKYDFLEAVDRQAGGKTILPEADGRARVRYKLTERRRAELDHFAAVFEDERGAAVTPPQPAGSRYRVLDTIGEGGMGNVYRAWDDVRQRVVALKVLSPEMFGDSRIERRFRREAKILELLDHPNVIRCHGIVDHAGSIGLVMDYVDGISLARLLAVQPNLPVAFVVEIARDVAKAIRHVHDRGVVRIDGKPGNILIRRDGQPVLADFGIARLPESQRESTERLTMNGFLLGTPHYMSPEQIRDPQNADGRADIYSFGVVLYEMLTGKLPYDSRSLPKLIDLIYRAQAPRVSTFVDVPPELDELVARCMKPRAADRPQTAQALSDVLDRIAVEPIDRADFVAHCLRRRSETEQEKKIQTAEVELLPPPPAVRQADVTLAGTSFTVEQLATSLAIVEPEEFAAIYPLRGGRLRIGRDPGADIVLSDVSVSRFHADVVERDGSYFMLDLNSSNGIYVNGENRTDEVELTDGDRVRIGRIVLLFRSVS